MNVFYRILKNSVLQINKHNLPIMEGAPDNNKPSSAESDDWRQPDFDEANGGRKKKKRAGDHGSLPVSPTVLANEQALKNQERYNTWKRLLGSDNEVKLTGEIEDQPLERTDGAEIAANQPLDELTPEEATLLTREFVRTRQETAALSPVSSDEELAVLAVEEFHSRVLIDNEPVDEAGAAVLQELGAALTIEAPAEARLTAETVNDHVAEASPSEFAGDDAVVELHNPGQATLFRSETAPTTTSPTEVMVVYDQSEVASAALVGGLIGYLIGRRRGRIKTEKRLVPIQKKLERQVKNLQQNVERQEFTIRQTAMEHIRQQSAETFERTREKAAFITRIDGLRDRSAHTAEGGEAFATAGQERQQIDQVLVATAEALSAATKETASRRSERPRPAAEKAPALPLDKHVETLKQKDLLELSGKIVVEGVSLRHVYESHQIGEQALRRIVSEHLRGGNVGEALQDELTQHEIDFERDPQLRDRNRRAPAVAGGGALQALIQRADAAIGRQDSQDQAVLEARADHQLKEQAQTQRQQRLINLSLISIIAVLVALIVLLIVNHTP